MGEGDLPDPDKTIEELDFARAMLETLLVPHGFTIPENDAEKFIIFNGDSYYYPPKEYYGKELTPTAFIDLMRQHRLLPITIGNIRVLQKWSGAKEDWGYPLVFHYLLDSFNIILTPEDEDESSDKV